MYWNMNGRGDQYVHAAQHAAQKSNRAGGQRSCIWRMQARFAIHYVRRGTQLTAPGGHGAATQRGPWLGLQDMLHVLLLRFIRARQQRLLQVCRRAAAKRGGKGCGAPGGRQAGAEPRRGALTASQIDAAR